MLGPLSHTQRKGKIVSEKEKVEKLAQRLAVAWLKERGKKFDRMEAADLPRNWGELPEEYKDLFRMFANLAYEELLC